MEFKWFRSDIIHLHQFCKSKHDRSNFQGWLNHCKDLIRLGQLDIFQLQPAHPQELFHSIQEQVSGNKHKMNSLKSNEKQRKLKNRLMVPHKHQQEASFSSPGFRIISHPPTPVPWIFTFNSFLYSFNTWRVRDERDERDERERWEREREREKATLICVPASATK